jgi:cytochrome c biogenesis protein CcdA
VAELIVIGVVAGFLAGVSPCIIPVLPVVLVAGGTAPAGPVAGSTTPRPVRHRLLRPVAVVAGLVLSFSLLVLAGSALLSLLHLPQDALRDVGIALLVVVGVGYLIPPVAALIERPFARIGSRQPHGNGGGFVLGLALGLLFVPCAGPILAAITVVGATHRVGLTAVLVTIAFALGAAVPLLAVALAGDQLSRRVGALRRRCAASVAPS